MNQKTWTTDQVEQIIHQYVNDRDSSKTIGDRYNADASTIRKLLSLNGVIIRGIREAQSWSVNENYFERIDTEEKAYFLGLLYADGCVVDRNPGIYQKMLKIGLQWSDRKILEKMRDAIEIETPIKLAKKQTDNCQDSAIIHVTNEKLCNDLIKLGCIPKKSLILKFPTYDQVPKHLMRHFIRGYFDGDGCIGYQVTKTDYHKFIFQICGTNHVCRGIMSEFIESIGLNEVKISSRMARFATVPLYTVAYCGNITCRKIFNYLYESTNLYLDRKFEKFKGVFNQKTRHPCLIEPCYRKTRSSVI